MAISDLEIVATAMEQAALDADPRMENLDPEDMMKRAAAYIREGEAKRDQEEVDDHNAAMEFIERDKFHGGG